MPQLKILSVSELVRNQFQSFKNLRNHPVMTISIDESLERHLLTALVMALIKSCCTSGAVCLCETPQTTSAAPPSLFPIIDLGLKNLKGGFKS